MRRHNHHAPQRKISSEETTSQRLTSPARTRYRDDNENNDTESSSDRQLCRFYVLHRGNCGFGSECAYSHELPEGMDWNDAKQLVPCPFFARGDCRYGDYCQLRHDPNDLIARQCASSISSKPSTIESIEASVLEEAKEDKEDVVTCGICLDDLPNGAECQLPKIRKFGLLSCCDHAFCFDCLMEWRKEGSQDASDRRSCPTCRKHSDYVVPSRVFPSSDEQKAQIVQDYKGKLAVIPCRRFQLTQELGSCPFGSDCFYAHFNENGVDVKEFDQSMEELASERQRYQEERRRRQQRDIRHNLGGSESTMEDIDILLSFLRLLDLYGYQGVREIYWSDEEDDDEGNEDGDAEDNDEDEGNGGRTYRFDRGELDMDETNFENVD